MPVNSSKLKKFNQILDKIKNVKVQGARNIARKALYAYSLLQTPHSKKLLLSARPTEPMMARVLKEMEKKTYKEITKHFDFAQNKINSYVFKTIKKSDIIFTHCHSTNVVNALKYSKRKGKKFEIYNTETRPLMQGRKTALELKKAGIKVTMFVDSAAMMALTKEQEGRKVTKVFLGADALLNNGIINKIGSGMFSKIANDNNIPIYIIADSWKYTSKKIPIENRKLNEVWNRAPKKIKIQNPAFEFVPKKYIKFIISELGILKYDQFLKYLGSS
jgi:translation initiation factor 2B subunit (eIF-2B alpha/beta/delta family)